MRNLQSLSLKLPIARAKSALSNIPEELHPCNWRADRLLSSELVLEGFDKPTERVDFEAYGAEEAEFTRSK